jgi:hypothetical protein
MWMWYFGLERVVAALRNPLSPPRASAPEG